MTLRVDCGKGAKDRYTRLSPRLFVRAAPLLDGGASAARGSFPADDPDPAQPLPRQTAHRIYHEANPRAGITKAGGIHACATPLPPICWKRAKTSHIQRLMGHGNQLHAGYFHLARSTSRAPSPLELLEASLHGASAPWARIRKRARGGGPGRARRHRTRHGAAYLRTHRLSTVQHRALRAIERCRTAALGGQLAQCDACGRSATLPLLPQPALPEVPDAGQGTLARRPARRTVAGALFPPGVHVAARAQHAGPRQSAADLRHCCSQAASETLLEFGTNPRWLGGEIAATLVLHTWGRTSPSTCTCTAWSPPARSTPTGSGFSRAGASSSP